jgi:hypothetical protein
MDFIDNLIIFNQFNEFIIESNKFKNRSHPSRLKTIISNNFTESLAEKHNSCF